jgi:O-antigen ligase
MLMLAPLAAVSVAFGLLQLEQGPDSALRFYRPTNTGDAVGFFANRNHFSALLYCALVVAGAWTTDRVRRAGGVKALVEDTRSFVTALAGVTTIVVVLCGLAMSRSRAGVALAFVAAAGAYALGYDGRKTDANPKVGRRRKQLVLGALAFGLLLQIPVYRALERFSADNLLEDARWRIARRALETAFAYFPFGSGVGSFVPVYASHERPSDVLPDVYINHAHDDFLEIFLEGGLLGLAITIGFVAWWGWRSLRLWRPTPGVCGDLYARAAALIVALLLAHSFVDYPLRSSAMMAVFALACAVLAAPDKPTPLPEAAHVPSTARKRRRASSRAEPASVPPAPPPSPRGRLEELEWPDEWTAR